MNKSVAIIQSSYIPWKGYFDIINMVDEFILFDDVQYTKRDWRNRNFIKTPQELMRLTIPVETKGKFTQRICDTKVADIRWAEKHWNTIRQYYFKAPYFHLYHDIFSDTYKRCMKEIYLSQINYIFIKLINNILSIDTRITWSMDYDILENDRNLRLVYLCQAVNANHYLSGPSASRYLDESVFLKHGITVSYMDYSGYPDYPQFYGSFRHEVSILDLLFQTGPDAKVYMKSLQL